MGAASRPIHQRRPGVRAFRPRLSRGPASLPDVRRRGHTPSDVRRDREGRGNRSASNARLIIVKVSGSSETKSRAASLSIKVAVMVRPGTLRRSLCDRFAIFEHATGRPTRRQLHTPEHAGRTLFHRSWCAASSHVSPHPSRTYGVYENPPWPQFLCEQARHRGERGLARAVTVGGFFARRSISASDSWGFDRRSTRPVG